LRQETARMEIPINYRGFWSERHVLFKFALPAALSGLVSMPAVWLANTFLVRQPGGYGQLALYSAAMNLRVLVLFLPKNVNNVVLSILNNQKGLGDERRYRQIFWGNIVFSAAVVLLGGSAIILLGPRLLGLYGKGFGEAFPVLIILVSAALVEAMAIAVYQAIYTKEMMWLSLFAIAIPNYTALVFLAYFLSPQFGAIGLAWAYAGGWTLAFTIIILLVWRVGLGFGGGKAGP
jgi:O-antigen/teichoic acid export membrane protein